MQIMQYMAMHRLYQARKHVPDTHDKISPLAEYITRLKQVISTLQCEDDDIIVYRGHAKSSFQFTPSLFREVNKKIREKENILLNRIEAERPSDFDDMTTLEKLVTLQHYEFPTRLLDVTSNPLVALYFAVSDHQEDDGAVIVCKVPRSMIHNFDSRIVVQMANLANFSEADEKILEEYLHLRESMRFNQNNNIAPKLQDKANKSLDANNDTATHPQAPAPEKPDKNLNTLERESDETDKNENDEILKQFKARIKIDMPSYKGQPTLEDLLTPVYVRAKQTNPRISAQKGAFLLFGLEGDLKGMTLETITIDHSAKSEIIRELDTFACINQGTLFPELDKFLTYTRQCAIEGRI